MESFSENAMFEKMKNWSDSMLASLSKKTTDPKTYENAAALKDHEMTAEERRAQQASFIKANTKLDKTASQESIDRALKSLS